MKTTYTHTYVIWDLTKATFKILEFKTPKFINGDWNDNFCDDGEEKIYKGVKAWTIITEEDAKEIEKNRDRKWWDDNHEYLVLHFEDGKELVFRNSYVDMFVK